MKPERLDQIASARLLIGLWIIVLGAVLLLANLGVINAGTFFRYFWPLVFLFVGMTLVMNQQRQRRRRLGWVLILIGAWMLINVIGLITVSIFKLLLPGVLIFVGGMLVWRAFTAPNGAPLAPSKADRHFEPPLTTSESKLLPPSAAQEPLAEFMRSFAVMSSNELRPVSRPFRGADLSAVMAGIKLNLLDARMESDSANIEVFAFWGGMEIYVPPDWTVVSKVTTLMGGFIDKRKPTTVLPNKTLVISGLVLMGGVEIKN